MRGIVKMSIRIDDNLKLRVELLAKRNNFSFTKMLNFLIEMDYQTYMKRFDKCYEEQNIILDFFYQF